MKVIIVALAFVAVAAAAAIDSVPKPVPQTLRSADNKNSDGSYDFVFETEDGINREENGEIRTVPNEKNEPVAVVVVRGAWSYTDPEGNVQTISYYADENGFHAEGPSVPKSVASS